MSIVEKARFLQQPYYPIIWMPGRHVQTIAGAIFADLSWMFRRPVVYEREGVRAWDGSELHLDWYSEGIVAIVWRSRGAMWGGALRAREPKHNDPCASAASSLVPHSRYTNDSEAIADSPYGDGLSNRSFFRRVATHVGLLKDVSRAHLGSRGALLSEEDRELKRLATMGVAREKFTGEKEVRKWGREEEREEGRPPATVQPLSSCLLSCATTERLRALDEELLIS